MIQRCAVAGTDERARCPARGPDRQQADAIEYLRAENEARREQLSDRRPDFFTDLSATPRSRGYSSLLDAEERIA